jgi:hypothetical protein
MQRVLNHKIKKIGIISPEYNGIPMGTMVHNQHIGTGQIPQILLPVNRGLRHGHGTNNPGNRIAQHMMNIIFRLEPHASFPVMNITKQITHKHFLRKQYTTNLQNTKASNQITGFFL